MKGLLTILGFVFAGSTFVSAGTANLTVDLGAVSVSGNHTNFSVECHVTITNGTGAILTVPLGQTNTLSPFPGLVMKVSDMDGRALKSMDHIPIHRWTWTFSPGTQQEFKFTYFDPSSLPVPAGTVRLQIEGTMLSGNSYSGSITSNVVEVKIPY